MKNKEREVFENRVCSENSIEKPSCQSCGEELIFGMKDNYHDFSLGLSTVLECLFIAENEGAIPKLPSEWKIVLVNRYPQLQKMFK